MLERLFTYGTLRAGQAPAALASAVAGFAWEGEARVAGRLYDLGAYPGAVLDAAADTWIHGQLARVASDPGLWALLDSYEGADVSPALFRRVLTRVLRADGEPLQAWVYEYARDPGRASWIASGRHVVRGTLDGRSRRGS